MHFNSQPHKEADNYSEWCSINSYISTHSLTRRLTTFGIFPVFPALAFQLTASQGGWRMNQRVDLFKWAFQLTASQGGWLDLKTYCKHSTVFQLTASQGGWQQSFHATDILFHFNSQPHKEADKKHALDILMAIIFQLTASQGGWQQFYSIKIASFNSFL